MRPEIDAPALLDRLGISYRRRGRALLAPCPLPGHTEKEPSWSMRDEPGEEKHGAHWCFGCDRGGGPADLVAGVLRVVDGIYADRNGLPVGRTTEVKVLAPYFYQP